MAEAMKREEVAELLRDLNECQVHLKRNNVYSCLRRFREVLRRVQKTRMLAQDERLVMKEINAFQGDLAASRAYRDMYGPATFRDNDLKTTLDFLEMLIDLKEEELREEREAVERSQKVDDSPAEGSRALAMKAKEALDRGDWGTAGEIIKDDEAATDMVFNMLVSAGIEHRRRHDPDRAIAEYRKALVIQPDDEGLYYNIARACVEKRDWEGAWEAVEQALEINPDFAEGRNLGHFIKRERERSPGGDQVR
ncbi:MAG TPA: tetratricopeptide repeat protein [Syntrophales bacterium]|nr:tetratricopeptide repeat protein [Syntrophales bacterium]